ncbi:MAG: FHA domain-containing protein [Cyanobacteria bacterium P01_F01_bin.86]
MLKIKAINYQTCQCQEEELTPETLHQGGGLIGRNSSCDIVLNNPEVSRVHGRITYHEGEYFFTDLGSTGGSVINGQEIPTNQNVRLKLDDLIRIGGFILLITAIETNKSRTLSAAQRNSSNTNGTISPRQTYRQNSHDTIPQLQMVAKNREGVELPHQIFDQAIDVHPTQIQIQQLSFKVEELELQGVSARDNAELMFQGKLLIQGISLSKHLHQRALDICQAELDVGKLCLLVEHPSHFAIWWEKTIENSKN